MTRSRTVPIVVAEHPAALGEHVARLVAAAIVDARNEGRHCVLGCPTGRSPLPVYRALERIVAHERLDLGHVVIALMDDYVDGPEGRPRRVDPALPHSCEGFARREILSPLCAAAGSPARGISPDALWVPDPADPAAHEDALDAVGGVDFFLLASGSGDGHIAFNPPGSSAASRTRVVRLAEQTRRDNLATFPFRTLDEVPRTGVTVGIATIRERSRRAVLVAHGAEKTDAVRRIAGAERYDPGWPATVLAECRDPLLVVDRAAAALLPTDSDRKGS